MECRGFSAGGEGLLGANSFRIRLISMVFNLLALPFANDEWPQAKLQSASDLIVLAMPIQTKDLNEVSTLNRSRWDAFDSTYGGVETSFHVLSVIKGKPADEEIVLHHYRLETEYGYFPRLIWFAAGDTNQYLLYLVKDGRDRYAPTTGQRESYRSVLTPQNGTPGTDVPLADASICHAFTVRVPTRLKVERTADQISVTIYTNHWGFTNVIAGTNMSIGVRSKLLVYPAGEPAPTNSEREADGGLDFNLGTTFLNSKLDGIPQA